MRSLQMIFEKPVNRPIQGVIKADDEESLRQEFEEYVITNEIAQRLESFLDSYCNYTGANGAWVSGFFGSGKSHLLKILALLLENRKIDGSTALDLFLPKTKDNKILEALLKKACAIPSKTILFNIDQKADIISKKEIDALLAVFMKVFDEMCGYYGKLGYIAQFERDLERKNLLQEFKDAYASIAKKEWTKGREEVVLESHNIDKAYAVVSGANTGEHKEIIQQYRKDYKVSIEDFSELVYDYIKKQPKDFCLNFFVDEVGQYIADNVKLMTNLQTIAESLATKCKGKSWIVVTAQENMDSVLGELNKQQSHDFTKIQARFNNRLKLTSANVAEVIQKRLLTKNLDGISLLKPIYKAHENHFKTLFDFADGAMTYQLFKDEEYFINYYPFIPYQFSLFQQAIKELSDHNAFEGRHSSVGERSMLAVFQQVAIQINDCEIGSIATFDLMFEGIATTLKSSIQQSIIRAKNELCDEYAIRVLKALFLVKYVKSFRPTLRNICVLMIDSFNQNVPELTGKVSKALNLLESQTYIQCNGDLYEYLTDEEKDIEQEIKNTEIENDELKDEISKIIFDEIIKTKKIRLGQQDFSYARMIDKKLMGRDFELSIHLITPFFDLPHLESFIFERSSHDELLIILPADEDFIKELLMFKKTEKYIQQLASYGQSETSKRINTERASQNNSRRQIIVNKTHELLQHSKLFVSNMEINSQSEQVTTRIQSGFEKLVEKTYPCLKMILTLEYKEDHVRKILREDNKHFANNTFTNLTEAEQEVSNYLQQNKHLGTLATVKSIIEKFERKPYGWPGVASLCIIASLIAKGKIEMKADSNLLEGSALEKALLNSHGYSNVVVYVLTDYPASVVNELKEFYKDFFDLPDPPPDVKDLAQTTGQKLHEIVDKLNDKINAYRTLPFVPKLKEIHDKLIKHIKKPSSYYLTDFLKEKDHMLDIKEQYLDPMNRFIASPQFTIFTDASRFLNEQHANLFYINEDFIKAIKDVLSDNQCFMGNKMKNLKENLDKAQLEIANKLSNESSQAISTIISLQEKFVASEDFKALIEETKKQFVKEFEQLKESLSNTTLIALIRDRTQTFMKNDYIDMTEKMARIVHPPKPGNLNPTPQKETISLNSVLSTYSKPWIEDENDLEQYLSEMRKAMLKEITQNHRRIKI